MKMKTAALVLLLTTAFVSCNKDKGIRETAGNNSVETTLTGARSGIDINGAPVPAGSVVWQVGSLDINGTDFTADYRKFSFVFYNDNTVIVTNGIINVPGKWHMLSPVQLSLFFNTSVLQDDVSVAIFNNLSAEWTVLKQSSLSMLLENKDNTITKTLRLDRK